MVDVFHALMGAWNDREVDRMFSFLTEDAELRTDPDWPDGGQFKGRDEISRFRNQFIEAWDVDYERIADPIRVGDRLVERGRWSGKGRASGIEGTIEFTSVLTYEGRLISSMRAFFDHEEAVAFARQRD